MEKIIEYGMCTGNNHEELCGYINEQIVRGYQPYGHPFTTIQHDALFIHQPMVLYAVEKKASKKTIKSELF